MIVNDYQSKSRWIARAEKNGNQMTQETAHSPVCTQATEDASVYDPSLGGVTEGEVEGAWSLSVSEDASVSGVESAPDEYLLVPLNLTFPGVGEVGDEAEIIAPPLPPPRALPPIFAAHRIAAPEPVLEFLGKTPASKPENFGFEADVPVESPEEGSEQPEVLPEAPVGKRSVCLEHFRHCNPKCGRQTHYIGKHRHEAGKFDKPFVLTGGVVHYDFRGGVAPDTPLLVGGPESGILFFDPDKGTLQTGFNTGDPNDGGSNCLISGYETQAQDDSSQVSGVNVRVTVTQSELRPLSSALRQSQGNSGQPNLPLAGGNQGTGYNVSIVDSLACSSVASTEALISQGANCSLQGTRNCRITGDQVPQRASPCDAIVASETCALTNCRDSAIMASHGVTLEGCAGVAVLGVKGPLQLRGEQGHVVTGSQRVLGRVRIEGGEAGGEPALTVKGNVRFLGSLAMPNSVQRVTPAAQPAPYKPPVCRPGSPLPGSRGFSEFQNKDSQREERSPFGTKEGVVIVEIRPETTLVLVANRYPVHLLLPARPGGGAGHVVSIKDTRGQYPELSCLTEPILVFPSSGSRIEAPSGYYALRGCGAAVQFVYSPAEAEFGAEAGWGVLSAYQTLL